MTHASFLELDRCFLGEGTPEAVAHAATCSRCGEYLRRLAEPCDVPAWLADMGEHEASRQARERLFAPPLPGPRARQRNTLALLLGAALALGGALILLRSPLSNEVPTPAEFSAPYTGAKGGSEVVLYVKRDQTVFPWNGERLRAGDRIRLRVLGRSYRHVKVTSPQPHGDLVLFEGEVSDGGALPVAWEMDATGTEERLRVTLSNPNSASGSSGPSTWVRDFVLQKTGEEQ